MASNIVGMAFMPYYSHLMKTLETSPELKKTAKGIFHQVAYAAAGTCVGGVVAGPPGALLGGMAGSMLGYMTVDHYDNLIKVIRGLSDDEKSELVRRVQELIGSTGLEALTSFIGSQVSREILINLVRDFAKEKGG